jgi:transcriptional regulator with XRE-family HTH domain
MTSEDFGPQNEEEARIYAEENFRIDVQMLIHDLMEQKGINQRQLAERLGVTESRVSQFFSDRFNMTVRKLAGVFHALGERPELKAASARAVGPQRAMPEPFGFTSERVFISGINLGTAQVELKVTTSTKVECTFSDTAPYGSYLAANQLDDNSILVTDAA